ncbi:energy-coupling factor ABC transporter permease [Raineyella sp. LH-20]|uniref:energy-coupling factor ABC transporter permease n=1 Tax=Raineyella sp. LH-20 TaxID=3081204 RepID=UPI002954044B|nr:energy-coupling factor ABC transporter permease [Raineyella sp. LH-20]WOP19025.1 energy-coupling factor ABC transporter permease [Raineyella sp. LH-20]
MHVPDGFLGVPVSVATGAVAAAALGLALRGSRRELGEVGAVRAGLTACFIFAAQMVNFPVAAGTSGHLLGGALAVTLVGPWTAVLVMSCVLVVQALVFADGGVTALGTNIVLMAVVGVGVATVVSYGLMALLGRRARRQHAGRPGGSQGQGRSVVAASMAGAFVSVPAAAAAFCLLYAIGGAVPMPIGALTVAMVGTHLLIGIGEALITGAVVGAVLAVRPDLVRLAGGERAQVAAVTLADGTVVLHSVHSAADRTDPAVGAWARQRPVGRRGLLLAAAAAVVIAGGLSLMASTSPDGLEHVAAALGFASSATSPVVHSSLADYGIAGLGAVGTSLAGVAGVALTLGLGLLVTGLVRRGRPLAGEVEVDVAGSAEYPAHAADRSAPSGEVSPGFGEVSRGFGEVSPGSGGLSRGSGDPSRPTGDL